MGAANRTDDAPRALGEGPRAQGSGPSRERDLGALTRARRLLILLACLTLTACVQMPSRPEGAGAAWAWGSFCGKDYPQVEATDADGRRAALAAIEPRDDLDAICKAHDLCYVEHGDHALKCDDDLARSAFTIRFEGEQRRACARLADQMGRFFACAMPSRGEGADGLIGALKPLTGLHPLCPGFTHADFWGAMRDAPTPGTCVARRAD